MGLLDDAIRQHLELKRQHGADESDVRRKEDEALGPARRESPAAGQLQRADGPDAGPGGDERGAGVLPEEALPPIDDPAEITPAEELAESEELAAEDLFADTPEGTGAQAPVEPDLLEEESPFRERFARDEGVPGPQEGEGLEEGEDVLEETPDFLQETPEHDRLWFEQKPPRDFDLDDDK